MNASEIPRTLSRRRLLKTGLWGGALVAVSGIGLSLQGTQLAPNTPRLAALSAREYAVLVAIADTVCPRTQQGLPAASELGIPAQVDALFGRADSDQQQGFKLALRVVEQPLTGALFGERLRPFSRLDEAGRARAWAAFRDSSLGMRRSIYAGVSTLIMANYWGSPRTWARIGYAGPPDVAALRSAYADNLVDLDALRGGSSVKGS
jgi:hypothetical protein